jgi:predicted nucleic acid-binding protein
MSLIVVDASVWVSRFVIGDVAHTRVRRWLEGQRAAGNELLSPSLLLPEVAGAITRRTTPALGSEALQVLEDLPGLRLVEMDAALIGSAAILAAELGLRGADSVYVAVAQVLGLPLATLDRDQRDRAGRLVEVVEF